MHAGHVTCSGDFSIFGDGGLGLCVFLCRFGVWEPGHGCAVLIGRFTFFVGEIGACGGAASANSVSGLTRDRF